MFATAVRRLTLKDHTHHEPLHGRHLVKTGQYLLLASPLPAEGECYISLLFVAFTLTLISLFGPNHCLFPLQLRLFLWWWDDQQLVY